MSNVFSKQVGGSHYQQFAIQPADFIIKNGLSYPQGCAIKYICRAGVKTKDPREDLEKAIHYIQMMIAAYEHEEEATLTTEHEYLAADDYDELDRMTEEEEEEAIQRDIIITTASDVLAAKWEEMLSPDKPPEDDTSLETFYTEPCDGSDGCSCASKEDEEEKKQQQEEQEEAAVNQSTDVSDDDIKDCNEWFIKSGGCQTIICSDCGYSGICAQVTSEYVEPMDASAGFKEVFTTVYTKIIDDTLNEVFQKSTSYVEFVDEMVKFLKSEHVLTDYQKQALEVYGLLPLYIALRTEKLEALTEQEFLKEAEAAYASAVPHVMDWVLGKLPYNKASNYDAFVKAHNGLHHLLVNAVSYSNIEIWNSHIPLGNMLFSAKQAIRDAIYLCGGDSLEVKVLLGLHLYSQMDRNDELFTKLVNAMHNFMEIASQDIIAYLADDLKHSSSFLEWTIRIRATIYQNLGDIKVIIQEELECDRYNKMSVLLYNVLVAKQLIGLADFFFVGRGFGKYLKWIVELNDQFSLKVHSGIGVAASTGYETPYEYLKKLRILLWHHSHQWEEATGGQSYDNKAMAFMHLAIIYHIKHVSSVVLDFKESFAFNKEPYETPDGEIRVLDDAMFEVALMLRDANKYEVATNGF